MPKNSSLLAKDRVQELFLAEYGSMPAVIARSPGRVNLIGEHTDYNEGFVLPIAVPFDTAIAASPMNSSTIRVVSEGFGEATFDLNGDPSLSPFWARYLHGVGRYLQQAGQTITGWTGYIATDIPVGANLSSSAALEIAAGLIFSSVSNIKADMKQLAYAGQYVENSILGLPSGIMDQMTCAFAERDSALLIDCRDLSFNPVKLPEGAAIVVMDTGTRRELAGTEYAKRRRACEVTARELGFQSLRDATHSDLNRLDLRNGSNLKRAQHVITENIRVKKAVEAIQSQDIVELGRLMTESHASLKNNYEVSGPALDEIVKNALNSQYCFGARMTGGGFAGCAIALVKSGKVDQFCSEILANFKSPSSQPAEAPTMVYPVRASAGASLIL
ncbi:MAG: galactokinase [Acidimicrobiales bacterium]|nr:galactokinase [Acidimicrobiales bacterium]